LCQEVWDILRAVMPCVCRGHGKESRGLTLLFPLSSDTCNSRAQNASIDIYTTLVNDKLLEESRLL
jgi:hypothetical protein